MKKIRKFKTGLALFSAAVLLVALFPHDGAIGQKTYAATTGIYYNRFICRRETSCGYILYI